MKKIYTIKELHYAKKEKKEIKSFLKTMSKYLFQNRINYPDLIYSMKVFILYQGEIHRETRSKYHIYILIRENKI